MRSDHVDARRPEVSVRRLAYFVLLVLGVTVGAEAGGPFDRPGPTRARVVVSTVRPSAPAAELNNYGRLGSFYPTPYLMVRGNAPAGGGYSSLGNFGETTLSLCGPTSSLRMTSAPVLTYTRGYDGRTVVVPGTSFSTPNLPALTPVVNPTQASYYYGFRRSGTPPWWASGMNWIDQN
jgi:hypothetical protein